MDLTGRFADTEIYILVEVFYQYKYEPMTFEALPELLAADTVEYIKLNDELDWKVNELVLYRKLAALTPIEAYKLIHSYQNGMAHRRGFQKDRDKWSRGIRYERQKVVGRYADTCWWS